MGLDMSKMGLNTSKMGPNSPKMGLDTWILGLNMCKMGLNTSSLQRADRSTFHFEIMHALVGDVGIRLGDLSTQIVLLRCQTLLLQSLSVRHRENRTQHVAC